MLQQLFSEFSIFELIVYAITLISCLIIFIGAVIELGRFLHEGIEYRRARNLPWWDLDH